MLVVHHPLKIGAHLATALARLLVIILARRSRLEAWSTQEKKGGEEQKKRKKPRLAIRHGKQEMPRARARVSQAEKLSDFTTLTSRAMGAVQRALGVGGCGNICFGHVLVSGRRSLRREVAGTGEGQLGRFAARKTKYIRLYLYSGKLILAATRVKI